MHSALWIIWNADLDEETSAPRFLVLKSIELVAKSIPSTSKAVALVSHFVCDDMDCTTYSDI